MTSVKAAIIRVSEWTWDEMSGMKLNADGVCVMVSARALKKNIFFDVDIVVKKKNPNVVFRGLYSYRQRVGVITLRCLCYVWVGRIGDSVKCGCGRRMRMADGGRRTAGGTVIKRK